MKRKEPMLLGSVIEHMIDATGLRPEYTRRTAEGMWAKVVGRNIAGYTTRLFVRDRTMHVYLCSAALKEELGYARENLVEKINEAVGESAIDNIVFH